MVQQLSLFGQISAQQHELTAASFTTLTGARSHNFTTHTLLCSPKHIVKYEPNSKNNQFEQYKLQLRAPYSEEATSRAEYKQWSVQVSDIPSAGKRKISTQNILESVIQLTAKQTVDDAVGMLGYVVDKEYLVRGGRWFYGNVVLELFQVLVKIEETWRVLDEQAWILKCFINVEKATDVDSLTKGAQELVSLKNELSGLVELEIPDRSAMDSRIGIRK